MNDGPVRMATCPADTNVAAKTEGSWWSRITGNQVDITGQNESRLVVGNLTDFVNGNKYMYIASGIEELFMINKNEQILGLETKLNIGSQNELTIALKLEINQAYAFELDKTIKYHLLKAGHGIITPHKSVEAARLQRIAKQVNDKIGSLSESVLKKHEVIKEFKEKCGKLQEKIDNMSDQITTFEVRFGTCDMKAKDLTRHVKNETVEAADYTIETKKDSILGASSITLEGGGATLKVDAIVKANSVTIV